MWEKKASSASVRSFTILPAGHLECHFIELSATTMSNSLLLRLLFFSRPVLLPSFLLRTHLLRDLRTIPQRKSRNGSFFPQDRLFTYWHKHGLKLMIFFCIDMTKIHKRLLFIEIPSTRILESEKSVSDCQNISLGTYYFFYFLISVILKN